VNDKKKGNVHQEEVRRSGVQSFDREKSLPNPQGEGSLHKTRNECAGSGKGGGVRREWGGSAGGVLGLGRGALGLGGQARGAAEFRSKLVRKEEKWQARERERGERGKKRGERRAVTILTRRAHFKSRGLGAREEPKKDLVLSTELKKALRCTGRGRRWEEKWARRNKGKRNEEKRPCHLVQRNAPQICAPELGGWTTWGGKNASAETLTM